MKNRTLVLLILMTQGLLCYSQQEKGILKSQNQFIKLKNLMNSTVFLKKGINSKNINSSELKLDSVLNEHIYMSNGKIEIDSFKHIYQYNNLGQHILTFDFGWDGFNRKSELSYKTQYTYNKNGSIWQKVKYKWDENVNRFKTNKRSTYLYDRNGNLSSLIQSYLDERTGQFTESKYEYFYISDILLSQIQTYFKDENGNWFLLGKGVFDYNDNKSMASELYAEWDFDLGTWGHDHERTTYRYDLLNNLILESHFRWSETQMLWEEYERNENEFSHTLKIANIHYSKEHMSDFWNYKWKNNYNYDAKGNLLQDVNMGWDASLNKWVLGDSISYEYDSNGNNTKEELFRYNQTLNRFTPIYKYVYSYNTGFYFSDMIAPLSNLFLPYWGSLISQPIDYLVYEWDESSQIWIEERRIKYFSSPYIINPIKNTNQHNAKVFPNPVTNYLNIKPIDYNHTSNFVLLDMNGRKVVDINIKNDLLLNVTELVNGIYFYSLSSKGQIQKGKVIKK